MIKLAIQGNENRFEEIIEFLQMMGAKNKYNLSGYANKCYYYIKNDNSIGCLSSDSNMLTSSEFYQTTLEELLERFPYKIGDEVLIHEYEKPVKINRMDWNGREIIYEIFTDDNSYWFYVNELKLYKHTVKKTEEIFIGLKKDSNGDWEIITNEDYDIKQIDGKFKLIKKKTNYHS